MGATYGQMTIEFALTPNAKVLRGLGLFEEWEIGAIMKRGAIWAWGEDPPVPSAAPEEGQDHPAPRQRMRTSITHVKGTKADRFADSLTDARSFFVSCLSS